MFYTEVIILYFLYCVYIQCRRLWKRLEHCPSMGIFLLKSLEVEQLRGKASEQIIVIHDTSLILVIL